MLSGIHGDSETLKASLHEVSLRKKVRSRLVAISCVTNSCFLCLHAEYVDQHLVGVQAVMCLLALALMGSAWIENEIE